MSDNNKTSSTKNTLLAAALGVASVSASAVPVTVSQTISLNDLLSGNSTGLQFNVNSLLSSQGLTSGDALSGTLVVYGLSDINYAGATPTPYSGYDTQYAGSHTAAYYYWVSGYSNCNSWSWSCYYSPGYTGVGYYSVPDYNEIRTRDIQHIDSVADVMSVTVGATTVSDTADQHYSATGGYGSYNYEGSSGGGNNSQYTYYNRERDTYEATYGDLNTSMTLDATAMADLTADGIISAFASAPVGQYRLLSAELTVTAEAPEPASLGLLGLGLAGIGMARRRRRKV